jgi:hypothetical protein
MIETKIADDSKISCVNLTIHNRSLQFTLEMFATLREFFPDLFVLTRPIDDDTTKVVAYEERLFKEDIELAIIGGYSIAKI